MSAPLAPLDENIPALLAEYLPESTQTPWLTLTYAQSLDARIAAAPGERTAISHAQTKTMTHYIRSKHDAIVVGINTVLADDPALNCRFRSDLNVSHSIRPVIIDPSFKFQQFAHNSKLVANYRSNNGLKPVIVVSTHTIVQADNHSEDYDLLKVEPHNGTLPWESIVSALNSISLYSVMVEGGACIINTLLNRKDLVDSLVVTVGPVYLGEKGVSVSPPSATTLYNVKWWTGIQDSVLCATLKQ